MATEKIKEFNNIVSSLINQLSDNIGIAYIKKFEDIIKYNSLLPIEQFLIHALPIRDKIINRDVSYFSNENNFSDITNDDKDIIDEILNLKNIYYKLDDNSKYNIWDFFQAMLILAEEYLKIKINK